MRQSLSADSLAICKVNCWKVHVYQGLGQITLHCELLDIWCGYFAIIGEHIFALCVGSMVTKLAQRSSDGGHDHHPLRG